MQSQFCFQCYACEAVQLIGSYYNRGYIIQSISFFGPTKNDCFVIMTEPQEPPIVYVKNAGDIGKMIGAQIAEKMLLTNKSYKHASRIKNHSGILRFGRNRQKNL